MVVVSEFVGCSPSVSGAIRVNPWSLDAVADGIYKAIKMPRSERHLRHDKHWRYISQHTVQYWTEVRRRETLLGFWWYKCVLAGASTGDPTSPLGCTAR